MTTLLPLKEARMLIRHCLTATAVFAAFGFAQEQPAAQTKNVTIIAAQSAADGKTAIAKEVLEECIVSLPRESELEAMVKAEELFMRDIGGAKSRNAYVKSYSASVTITYLVRQKELIIVTTNAVTAQKPEMTNVERQIPDSVTIISEPSEGDLVGWADGKRRYYFGSPEGAIASAKKRAAAWLKQRNGLTCPQK
jgi:hypothetical protein